MELSNPKLLIKVFGAFLQESCKVKCLTAYETMISFNSDPTVVDDLRKTSDSCSWFVGLEQMLSGIKGRASRFPSREKGAFGLSKEGTTRFLAAAFTDSEGKDVPKIPLKPISYEGQ
jgi:hypothetical protein